MAKKDVKTNLLDHSEAKVKLLGEYIKRYLSVICNEPYIKKIRLYDLSCGEGLYNDEGEGSPIVLLNAVKEIYNINLEKNKPIPKIDCYFNDIKTSKIEKLKRVIEQKALHDLKFGNITFKSNDYIQEIESLTTILKSLKDEKVFIFIDPYGYKNIKASQINALMQYRNAEVLLWLPTQHMYRFSKNEPPKALFDFLDEFKGIDEEESRKNAWKFIKALKNGFQKFIGDNFFVDSFSIQKEANTVFCLYFFTSHIRGFEKMLEAKWEIAPENGIKWEYSGNSPSLFFEQKANELEIKLKEFLVQQRRYNKEVYEFTLKQGYLLVHTNQIFKNWQDKGLLIVYDNKDVKVRSGWYYNNYENYRDNPKKVYYKLNF